MALASINPSSGEVLESFEEATPAALERVLAHAWQAFLGWRECTFAERAARLREVARVLGAKKVEYARLMALEMGKPVAQGEAEVEKCAWGCEYYAEHAARFLAPEPRETDAARSYVRFDPLGPVLAVMPWNFPYWQVFRFAAPALMAGNAGILKHASNVPRCALEIEGVFRAAGLPEGLFGTVLVGPPAVPALIADARIRAVTLTGGGRGGGQRPVHRPRGRGPAARGQDRGVGAAREQRAELHRGQALHRGGEGGGALPRALRRRDAGAQDGRPAGARHRGGPAGARRPARRAPPPGRGVGQARRAPPAGRERAARPRRLLPAHHLDRRRQGDARLRRGDLRPGGGRRRRARRGGRHPPRERLHLRARRVPLDREPGARRAPRAARRGGLRVRERARQVGPAPPLRRHQALGLRARALGVRHPRVREREERLDRVGRLTWASPS